VDALPWDSPDVPWDLYAAAVVRSTWDYHRRPDAFRRWLDALSGLGARVWNPASLLRWNMDKRYLIDLPARLPVVRGELVEPGTGTTLAAVLERRGWRSAVVKPAISASGEDTWRTDVESAGADGERFRALVARGAVLVQPFVEQVVKDGEWSLVYFRGAFSHAILKRPRAGEFRVQSQHGGRSEAGWPSLAVLSQAERVLAEVREPWLYARVDGCVVDGTFLLMELEMLEPALELWADPGAPRRFADAVLTLV
jgi:hypothetical protein